jgi:CheY-like chemotaxis protein
MARILVVEDEPGIALGLEDSLRLEGYQVEVVTNGVKASCRALEEEFDFILLDVMLPGKNGFEVCRELRRSGLEAPIIFLTDTGVSAAAGEMVKLMNVWTGEMRGHCTCERICTYLRRGRLKPAVGCVRAAHEHVNVSASDMTKAVDRTTPGTGKPIVIAVGANPVVVTLSLRADVSTPVVGVVTVRADVSSSRTAASSSCTDATSSREFMGPVCNPLILSPLS